jgi:hypothetical protein
MLTKYTRVPCTKTGPGAGREALYSARTRGKLTASQSFAVYPLILAGEPPSGRGARRAKRAPNTPR